MLNIIEITDLSAPELAPYAKLSEVQLLRFYEPAPGLFIAESPKVIERALNAGYRPVSLLLEQSQAEGEAAGILTRCEGLRPGIPIYTAESSLLASLTGFRLTRGVLCAMERKALPPVEEICSGAKRIAVLEHIVNPTNVGAIFRSAAALGIDAVVLTPDSCDPLYRRAARVSMGTVFQVPWTFFNQKLAEWPARGMAELKRQGFQTAALALSNESIPIDTPALAAVDQLAILLGSEGDGLSAETIALCDYTVRIPMYHGVDSLNVAAASAVAFWVLNGDREKAHRPSNISLRW